MRRLSLIIGLLVCWAVSDSAAQDARLLTPDDIRLARQLDRLLKDRSDEVTGAELLEGPATKRIGGDDLLGDDDDLLGGDLLGDDLLGEGDDLLGGDSLLPAPRSGDDPLRGLGADDGPIEKTPAEDPHLKLWTENSYPSAESCRSCHPNQYEEWRASGHAYAAVSPMFHRFEQAMTDLTRGTVGSFCVRCHSPVGTQLEIPRASSLLEAPPVVREGVTCIACHRVREHYWRSNGDRRIEPGDIHQPVGSSGNGAGLAEAIRRADELKLRYHSNSEQGGSYHGGSHNGSHGGGHASG
ncbi:MAG: multiheme c-type cytochrome, partial [Planctomycetota bacterium]